MQVSLTYVHQLYPGSLNGMATIWVTLFDAPVQGITATVNVTGIVVSTLTAYVCTTQLQVIYFDSRIHVGLWQI